VVTDDTLAMPGPVNPPGITPVAAPVMPRATASRLGLIPPVAAMVIALLATGVGPHVGEIRRAFAFPPPAPPSPANPAQPWFPPPRATPPTFRVPAAPAPFGRTETIQLGGGYVLRGSAVAAGGFTLWHFDALVCPNVSRAALPLVTPDGAVWFSDDAGQRVMRFHPRPNAALGPPDPAVPKPPGGGPVVTTLLSRRTDTADAVQSIQLHEWRAGWIVVRLAPPGGTGLATDELIDWKAGTVQRANTP
jgi:hypothetical protein